VWTPSTASSSTFFARTRARPTRSWPGRSEVAPEAVGLAVTAVIGVVQDSSGDTEGILESLREHPEIESCFFMAGEESFLLKVRVATITELETLIVGLNRTKGIARTRTAIALSTKWEGRPRNLTSS
jgi:Lrp/AsnC family transcriptional regulator, leucine-responsive regulatory protein